MTLPDAWCSRDLSTVGVLEEAMKTYSLEEISGTRAYFVSKGYLACEVEYKGVLYPYFLVPRGVFPVRNFAMRVTPDPALLDSQNPVEISLFGVSDEVPMAIRPYFVLHEIIEFVALRSAPGSCAIAARRELSLVADAMNAGVLSAEYGALHRSLRFQFFTDFVRWAQEHPQDYTPDDVMHFQESERVFQEAATNQ